MGRIIKGQVIASTGLDLHGESLTEEMVRIFYEQLPDVIVNNNNHDMSERPVSRGFNKELVTLSSGELAITMDVEVLDEESFAEMGGVSIAFTNHTLRYGDSEPAVRVLVNPRHYDFEEFANELAALKPPGYTLDVTERVEKAAVVEAVIVVVAFAASTFAAGFLTKAGGAFFEYLKQSRGRKKTGEQSPTIQLRVEVAVENKLVVVLLQADADVPPSEIAAIDLESLESRTQEIVRDGNVQRIVGKLRQGPTVDMDFFVEEDGRVGSIDDG